MELKTCLYPTIFNLLEEKVKTLYFLQLPPLYNIYIIKDIKKHHVK